MVLRPRGHSRSGPVEPRRASERRRKSSRRSASRAPGARRQAVTERTIRRPSKPCRCGMRDGRTLRGLAKYESPFDLGVHSLDGKFHSISRVRLRRLRGAVADAEGGGIDRGNPQPSGLPHPARRDRSPARPSRAAAARCRRHAFADIARPKPGEWPTYHGHLSGNRHSPLDQINTTNVAQLAPKWIFPIPGAQRRAAGHAGRRRRRHVRDGRNEAGRSMRGRAGRSGTTAARARQGLVGDPASGINRGVAVLGDRVFMQTDHAHLIALHRLTGQLLWDVEMADYRQNYGATGAPLVVNDLVIAGVSGGDEGSPRLSRRLQGLHRRACLALLDGSRAWRAGLGNVGRKGARARLRRHVAHRHLRSRSEAALLADRQSLPRLQRRRAQGRQPVFELGRSRSIPTPGSSSGTSSSRRTTFTTGMRPRLRCSWTRSFAASRASCCSTAIAMASSTCSIA